MPNLAIPAPAIPLPSTAAAPTAPDAATAGAPDGEYFSAVLARELIAKALVHETTDAALPVGAAAEIELTQPDAGIGPLLQMPPDPSLVEPALLALMPAPGSPPADSVAGDQREAPPGTALPAVALRTEPSAPRNSVQPALPGKPAREPVGTADSAASGKFLPPLAAAGNTYHFGAAQPAASRLPDAAPDKTYLSGAAEPAASRLPDAAPDKTYLSGATEPAAARLPEAARLPDAPPDKTFLSGAAEPEAARLPEAAPLLRPLDPPALAAAASPAIGPASAAHKTTLDTRIGAPAWDGEFAHKVVWLATRQQQVAELHLNPPHLGPVEVMLTIGNDQGPQQPQQASAQFTSPHSAVREAIEAALPRLREMMADNGIALGNVTVSAESFQQQAEAGRQDRPPLKHPADMAQTASGFAARAGTTLIRSGHDGLVDTFA